ELWQTDGRAAGTVLVRDINPGSADSDPAFLVAMNNKLYFSADDGMLGRELWDPPPVEPPADRGADVASADPTAWPIFGHDPAGTRYNFAETRLRPDNVGRLREVWRFPTDGPVIGTPVVVNDRVYAADTTGTVYALTRDGGLLWRATLSVPTLL